VSELRFAVTLQDLRTVVLLRRRLSQERPRSRPWVRLPGPGSGRWPTWRRDWSGILRFPAVRVVRMVVLGAVAGAALVGMWAGTSTLIVVAGLALYVAALDAVEPLAQEIDHPDRWAGLPVEPGGLLLRHLPASVVVMAGVGLVTTATAAALGSPAVVLPIAAALLVPTAAAATTAAAASTSQGMAQVKPSLSAVPEAAGTALVLRNGWPVVLVVVTLLPVLVAQATVDDGIPGAPIAAVAAVLPVLLVAVALFWVSRRTPVKL
jgi:nitrogen fixation protein